MGGVLLSQEKVPEWIEGMPPYLSGNRACHGACARMASGSVEQAPPNLLAILFAFS